MENIDSGKLTVYLMRHGETILNKNKRTQGWCDGILTNDGMKSVKNTGIGLSNINFNAVYSSDLGRAIKSATIVINENKVSNNLELKQVEGLREVCFGKYEGEKEEIMMTDILEYLHVDNFKEAEEKYDFQKEFCNACAKLDETHEAENYKTALSRAIKSLKSICIENFSYGKNKNILLVIHGGILRLIIDYLDKSFNIRKIDNSSISKLIYDGNELKVECVNDVSYIKNIK